MFVVPRAGCRAALFLWIFSSISCRARTALPASQHFRVEPSHPQKRIRLKRQLTDEFKPTSVDRGDETSSPTLLTGRPIAVLEHLEGPQGSTALAIPLKKWMGEAPWSAMCMRKNELLVYCDGVYKLSLKILKGSTAPR
ncbi:unnamed protein product [Lepidochelys kempii]